MGTLPGHVKVAVPAGGMALFDMRTPLLSKHSRDHSAAGSLTTTQPELSVVRLLAGIWHTGMPNTNGSPRENYIFTFGAPNSRDGALKHEGACPQTMCRSMSSSS